MGDFFRDEGMGVVPPARDQDARKTVLYLAWRYSDDKEAFGELCDALALNPEGVARAARERRGRAQGTSSPTRGVVPGRGSEEKDGEASTDMGVDPSGGSEGAARLTA